MSRPLRACLVFKAALGDDTALKQLIDVVQYNSHQVAHTQLPCECNPPCPRPTAEQLDACVEKVNKALVAYRAELQAKARPTPSFDKVIFPVIKRIYPQLPKLEDIFDESNRS